MSFRVEITAEAEGDLDSILAWLITEHAGDTGLRWFDALQDAIATLAEFPDRCSLAPESKLFRFEVRQLLYGNNSTFIGSFLRSGRRRCTCFTFDTDVVSL